MDNKTKTITPIELNPTADKTEHGGDTHRGSATFAAAAVLDPPADAWADYRALARNRQNLGWCLSEAAFLRRIIASGKVSADPEVEAGIRHKHDILCLIAAAMPAASKAELDQKHDALAGVTALDPALGHLVTAINAALAADWRRLDDARKLAANPFRLH